MHARRWTQSGESVHQLDPTDQIVNLGLTQFYTPLQSEIRARSEMASGSLVFAGLRKQTVSSIKSYEAIDICWIEEASVVKAGVACLILLPERYVNPVLRSG